MALSPHDDKTLNNLELEKFAKDDILGTVVKTVTSIFGGQLTILAPYDTENRTFDVTSTETPIPIIPNMIAIMIYNKSQTETICLGKTGVLYGDANGSLSGADIGPRETHNESVTDNSALYLIADTGKTAKVKVRYYLKQP